jgi:hypothetical protein
MRGSYLSARRLKDQLFAEATPLLIVAALCVTIGDRKGGADMSKPTPTDSRLLELHQLHLGLYARIAKKLNVTPSYISRVARGERESSKVMSALLTELRKLQ